MREIKFRAWDTVQEKILPVEKIDFRNDCVSLDEGDNSVTDTFEMFHLMQYTGCKDDNGKEIYEGDVIQFEWLSDSCWGKAGTYKGYVRFNEGVFEVVYIGREKITKYPDGGWHENSESDDIRSLMSWSEDIEVIGNIYENPEMGKAEASNLLFAMRNKRY